MKVLAQFVVVFLLQIELFSAMRISHKKVLKDSKDSTTAIYKRIKRSSLSNALVITGITSYDRCFVKGKPYIIRIKFRNVVEKNWMLTLNQTQISNLKNILTDRGLIAVLTISADLYIGSASYGDTSLNITITSGRERRVISKTICVRLKVANVMFSTVNAARINLPVSFYIYSPSISGTRTLYVKFNDNVTIIRNTDSSIYTVQQTYNSTGKFTYNWTLNTQIYVADGSGTINILQLVGRASDYTFEPMIEKQWPDSRVTFNITRLCGFPQPTSALFRLHYGDGNIAEWMATPIFFECNRVTTLRAHTYQQPGCYNTTFELRNPLGRIELNGTVRINQRILSLALVAFSISTLVPVVQDRLGIREFYVQSAYPFNVTATTTGGRCRTFEWRILRTSWVRVTYEVNSIIVSHLINSRGSYDVEVKVENKDNSLTRQIRVVVAKPLLGLLLISNTTRTGTERAVTFYLLVEESGLSTTFNWTFGDGNSEMMGYSSFITADNLPGISSVPAARDLNLKNFSGITKSYKFRSLGLYNVVVTATDIFRTLTAERTILISDRFCLRPQVSISTQNHSKRLIFNIGETFTVVTNLNVNCDSSNQAVFRWTLLRSSEWDLRNNRISESDKVISFPQGVVTNQREITIQKRTLVPGIYMIRLTVSMANLGYSDSDEKYLEIKSEPMFVRIEGGSLRLQQWEQEVVLNGSASYDPNVINGSRNDILFKWYCKIKPDELPFTIEAGGCFGYGEDLIESRSPIWTIQPRELVRNAAYIIRLAVESRVVGNRRSTAQQTIEIRGGTVLRTSIRCVANCKLKLDTQMRVSLLGVCLDCGRFVSYNWSLHTNDSRPVQLEWLVDTRTPQNSISFVLFPSILSNSARYNARFTALTPRGERGYSEYSFSTSVPPYGGSCKSTPLTGQAVTTNFTIFCEGWKGENGRLSYSVSLVSRAAQKGNLKDNSASFVLSYGTVPHTSIVLPEGTQSRNYSQQLVIRIIDSFGYSTTVSLAVQVLPFSTNFSKSGDTAPEDTLETYLYGKKSALSKLVGSGDSQALGRFASAIGKSLDTARESTNASLPESTKQRRKLKRERMRGTLIESLTKVKVTTLENFSLVSGAMKGVSSTQSELNKRSQEKMLEYYGNTSKFMTENYSKWNERDPKAIQDAIGGYLTGAGNMLNSATLTRSNITSEQASYTQFVQRSLQIIDGTSKFLFQSTVPNEIARRFDAKSVSVEFKMVEERQITYNYFNTLGGGRIRSPARTNLFTRNNSQGNTISFKMVSLQRNPFTWDKQNIGKTMNSTVTSFKLLSEGKELAVNNLPSGDEFILELPTPSATLATKSAVLNDGEIRVFCNYLPTKGIPVMARTRCNGSSCQVFVSNRGRPSSKNYIQTFTVEDMQSTSQEEGYRVFSNTQSAVVCFGISKVQSNVTRQQPTTVYLDLFLTGCFYWDRSGAKWSSDGCMVANTTSVNKTICLCNHLTWFGAGILVKPNVLDIAKESIKLKNLADYPALLASVCTIGGLYLLIMIWARNKDKRDMLETELIIVESCCRTHKYRYDVTIYTGSRPGSGTTSSVCMMLGGSLGESDPQSLSSHTEKLFKRGSVDTFLITSSKSLGNISCIRFWIDNSGSSPAWFVSRVIVTNLLDGSKTTFLCHEWLGIGIDDGRIDKVFVPANDREMQDSGTIFLTNTSRGFSDDHLWFSITMRPPRSNFTRCQRVSCCFCVLLCTMLANAMFYQTRFVVGTQVSIGSFKVGWRQVAVGIQSAILVLPINILIVTLFRKAAPSEKNEQFYETEGSTESTDDLTQKEVDCIEAPANLSEASGRIKRNARKSTAPVEDFYDIAAVPPAKVRIGEPSEAYPFGTPSAATTSAIPVPVFRTYATKSAFTALSNVQPRNKQKRGKKGYRRLRNHKKLTAERKRIVANPKDVNVTINLENYSSRKQTLTIEQTPGPSLKISEEELDDDMSLSDAEMKKEAKAFWPRWCLYVAWLICAATSAGAGYITLLYGLSFGKVVQEKWLFSFFLSVFEDIFIFQPGKIVLIGCLFAFIFKKLSFDEELPEVELAKNENWVKSNLPLQSERQTAVKVMMPLTKSFIRKANKKKLKEARMTNIFIEIVVYFFYIFLGLLIAYGHRSPNAYLVSRNIENMIIRGKFDKVYNVTKFWKWLESTFLPSVYGKVWYNGKVVEADGLLADFSTYLIGSPMIRQIRVLPEKCPADDLYDFGNKTCGNSYTGAKESQGNYERGWKNTPIGGVYGSYGVEKTRENPWTYKSQKDLKGLPFAAKMHTYPGGGYARSLGKALQEANSTVRYLKQNLWIDTLTRAVFLELTVFNNNEKFFSIITLVAENTGTGKIIPFSEVITTRLDRYNSAFSFFLAACEVSFLLLSFYYGWLEVKKARNKGIKNLLRIGSIIELTIFVMLWTTFGFFLVRLTVVNRTKTAYKGHPNNFTSFQHAASSDKNYGYSIATVVVLIFLKILKVLRTNKDMLLLLKTMEHVAEELKHYFLFFALIMIAFICWAALAFGSHLFGYATIPRTFMSLFNLLLGRGKYYDLLGANRLIAPIFYAVFAFIMCFIVIDIFLTIVIGAFSMIRVDMANKPNKYDIYEFLYSRIMQFCPWLNTTSDMDLRKYNKSKLKGQKLFDIAALEKKLEKIDNCLDAVLLSEYREIGQFSRLALRSKYSVKGRASSKKGEGKSKQYLDVK